MKYILSILFCLGVLFFHPTSIRAQEPPAPQYSTGTVTAITQQQTYQLENNTGYVQHLTVREDGTGTSKEIVVGSEQLPVSANQLYAVGDKVVLGAQQGLEGQTELFIVDTYRIPAVAWLFGGFFLLVVVVSGWRGITSLIGMASSIIVLLVYMVPQITAGANPLLVSIVAASVIGAVIIYLGHGFHYRSHIALFCMFATLTLVGILSYGVVTWAHIRGTGDETANFLQFSGLQTINLQGLFLGGIILASLSVLDDSIVSQVSVLSQLKKVKKSISFQELFQRGMEVGKDHISTLVNTLVLAYAGASLPLFILFTLTTSQSKWVSLNDPMIAEEIVRTITGSIGLVLSIPLTTFIAAYVIQKKESPKE